MHLITEGVKSVLFSDVASGLLHEEMACRLPFRLSKEKNLLKLLVHYGISLYAWSSAYKDTTKTVSCTFDDIVDIPRLLTLDMIFDESENIYDASVLRYDPIVHEHAKKHLYTLVPEETALTILPSFENLIGRAPSMLLFLSEAQMGACREELEFELGVAKVLLGRTEKLQPLLFSSPMTKRLLQTRCIGTVDSLYPCQNRASREAIINKMKHS